MYVMIFISNSITDVRLETSNDQKSLLMQDKSWYIMAATLYEWINMTNEIDQSIYVFCKIIVSNIHNHRHTHEPYIWHIKLEKISL